MYKFNPFTGTLDFTNRFLKFKESVPTESDLPLTGNEIDDARIVNENQHLYVWDGNKWVDNGDVLDLYWQSIIGKPNSSPSDIDNTVNKFIKSDIIYYVDINNGDDNNPGTEEQPFKTLHKAISMLNNMISSNYNVMIQLLPGDYEGCEINKIFVKELTIRGSGYWSTNIIQREDMDSVLYIYNSNAKINIEHFNFVITKNNSSAIKAIESKININYCNVISNNSDWDTIAIEALNNSIVSIQEGFMSNNYSVKYGVKSEHSIVYWSNNGWWMYDRRIYRSERNLGIVIENGKIIYPGVFPIGFGVVYFIDPDNGDDSNPGTEEQPLQTINNALARFAKNSSGISALTIYLKSGIYREVINIDESIPIESDIYIYGEDMNSCIIQNPNSGHNYVFYLPYRRHLILYGFSIIQTGSYSTCVNINGGTLRSMYVAMGATEDFEETCGVYVRDGIAYVYDVSLPPSSSMLTYALYADATGIIIMEHTSFYHAHNIYKKSYGGVILRSGYYGNITGQQFDYLMELNEGAVRVRDDASIQCRLYVQDTEPTLYDGAFCFWLNTSDEKLYLIYNLNGTNKKVELT